MTRDGAKREIERFNAAIGDDDFVRGNPATMLERRANDLLLEGGMAGSPRLGSKKQRGTVTGLPYQAPETIQRVKARIACGKIEPDAAGRTDDGEVNLGILFELAIELKYRRRYSCRRGPRVPDEIA
ncbi:MAG TPA: hypothetical protein VD840_07800 [Sinorhizobium sp.]|nr:hypothetical protein [Sinorhizobium sp.]